jgi:quercetin dioxygenase-like cupin family protein
MRKFSLDALAREHLERAVTGSAGRSATTVYGGHEQALRHTLVALTAGTLMTEHDSPGQATLIVLRGRVRLNADPDSWEGRSGDLLVIPPARHSLQALEDSVVLLTVVKEPPVIGKGASP